MIICKLNKNEIIAVKLQIYSRANPGFLERGFVCIKVWGFTLLILSHFSEISHENEINWSH